MALPYRVVTLRLQEKTYPDQTIENYLTYKSNRIDFDESSKKIFIELLPDFWYNEKDKLSYFAYFDDGSFSCQKNKEVYNYSIRETEEKLYNFDAVNEEQLNNFIQILEKYFVDHKIKETTNLYDQILNNIKDVSYLKYQILELRSVALQETDYMFNRDYVFKDLEEEILWKKYRQEWRDITEQSAWQNKLYGEVVMPISPNPKNQILDIFKAIGSDLISSDISPTLAEEMTETLQNYYASGELDSLIKNYASITLRVEILKSFSKLKIPLGGSSSELQQIKDSLFGTAVPEELKTVDTNNIAYYLSNIEQKISEIDDKLKEYKLDFSVSDILEKITLDIQEKARQEELEDQAMNLLEDIVLDNTEV